MTLYLLSSGSIIVSRNSMPSVKYLIRVRFLSLTSSNRMVYPTYRKLSNNLSYRPLSQHTSSPKTLPTSVATLDATEVAATLRGCVQAITLPFAAHPASYRYCGNSNTSKEYQYVIQSEFRATHELFFHSQFGQQQ